MGWHFEEAVDRKKAIVWPAVAVSGHKWPCDGSAAGRANLHENGTGPQQPQRLHGLRPVPWTCFKSKQS